MNRMSLLPAFTTPPPTTTTARFRGGPRDFLVPLCTTGDCTGEEKVPFFKMLRILVIVIAFRSVVSIVLKLPTLWLGAIIVNQNMATLVVDILSKRFLILLIFLMALNRFLIIFCPALDNLLFARYRYIALCMSCLVISAAETYAVIAATNLRRVFVSEIGFVDYIDATKPYEISCFVFLAVSFTSLCLQLIILMYLRSHSQSTSTKTGEMQKRMLREVAIMAMVNTAFTLLFIILYQMPSSYESRMVLISIYNILCFVPDILIPVCILIGSREVHEEISSRFSSVMKVKPLHSHKTVTISHQRH
nr:Hypothetical protein CBG01137 [Haemonchus contortus]